jgi:hypothetical protein
MHEPAACGTLPAQQANLHIGPLATSAEGMLAHRIDRRSADPRTTLKTRIAMQPELCRFSFGTIHLLGFWNSVTANAKAQDVLLKALVKMSGQK